MGPQKCNGKEQSVTGSRKCSEWAQKCNGGMTGSVIGAMVGNATGGHRVVEGFESVSKRAWKYNRGKNQDYVNVKGVQICKCSIVANETEGTGRSLTGWRDTVSSFTRLYSWSWDSNCEINDQSIREPLWLVCYTCIGALIL